MQLDLPHTLAAIAAVLLDDARPGEAQLRRKLRGEFAGAAVEPGIGAPAEMPGTVQDLLHPHLQDDVRVGADPGALRGDLAQQRVERFPRLALVDRVDPHQDAVGGEQLRADLVGEGLIVDRGLGVDAERRQFFEDPVKAAVLRRRVAPRLGVAARQHGNLVRFRIGNSSGHAPLLAGREAQSLDNRLTGCLA
jgi:hypothetical protein